MKISYNWLKQFIDINQSPDELSLILTDIGLEVEAVEKIQSVPGGLDGLVVGEVLTCQQHPNADRLRVATVNVGSGEALHIVCGAPNVAAGQKVIVATVGTMLYPLGGEPFKIKKSKIRGEVSEGMLCAEDEIGLGESHEGILVLPVDTRIGMPAKEYFGLNDDYLIEIGLTPNRADAASHLGVARDLAAYLRTEFKCPETGSSLPEKLEPAYPVSVESKACKRYVSCIIRGVKVEQSPDWLREKLNVIGIRPINNVVDVTNYVLHGLGQPLHAFDAEQIRGNKVVVRQAVQDERFVTLDGVERKLDGEDLMICDAEKPMCLAGVFGGESSGVSEETTEVFLESAYFDSVSVRKSSKRHGLKTDASFRFERGTDPDLPLDALHYAVKLIQEVAGGERVTEVSDIYPDPVQPFSFEVSFDRVRKLIGKDIPNEEIKSIIIALGIRISNETTEIVQVSVPSFKVDVTREVDVIEEVLRIYGYNNVEIGGQLKSAIQYAPVPDRELVSNQVFDLLVSNGYLEIMNNSLSHLDHAIDPETAVRIVNPLSSDLDTMRQSLLYSVLETVEYNQKRKAADLKLFEFGKVYHLAENGYREDQHLALALTGRQVHGLWNGGDQSATFYHLKAVVDGILQRLGLGQLESRESSLSQLAYGLEYLHKDRVLVTFGGVSAEELKRADVQGAVFYATFDWDLVLKSIYKKPLVHKEISKFPAVRRDLALLLDNAVSFEQLKNIATRTERKFLKEVSVFDVYKGDKLPEGKKSYALSFILQDEEKTMDDKRIDAIVNKLIVNFEKETGASVRK